MSCALIGVGDEPLAICRGCVKDGHGLFGAPATGRHRASR